MLRCAPALLGRWSSRDFLRGRSKRAGAVHTRHTHGRQGRFKRLSTKYSSIRDGRRHASNHMQGGLGIKLGGGLFGLRIPRQHQLSHLSRDDFELEVYGHPNITNPYREHLNEHPDLKSVMMNAEVAVQMVVLMPRVGRRNEAARADREAAPESWLRVVREVSAAVDVLAPPPPPLPPLLPPEDDVALDASSSPPVEVHFTTLETSVCCRWPPSAETPVSPNLAAQLEASAAQLYGAHCRLGQTLRLVQMKEKTAASSSPAPRTTASPSTFLPRHSGRRPAVFMGAALKAPASHSSSAISSSGGGTGAASAGGSFTSSVLAQLTREAAASSGSTSSLPSCADGVMGRAPLDAPAVPFTDGVVSVVHRLTSTERPILRVCMRPTKGEKASNTQDAPAATAVPQRKVLKADIDPHAEIGVWTLPRSPLQELLRWHYCAHDPRAHNHDALPHHRRSLPLLLVVDYSTVDHSSGSAAAAASAMSARRGAGGGGVASPTLMPRRLSLEMETAGFRVVQQSSLRSVGEAIARWSPSAQWDRLTRPTAAEGTSDGGHHRHHYRHEGAARALC